MRVIRRKLFHKILFLVLLLIVFYFLITIRQNFQTNITINTYNLMRSDSNKFANDLNFEDGRDYAIPKLKYILLFTSPKLIPFVYLGEGRSVFLERNCTYTNCYVTSNKHLIGDQTKFDAVLFAGPQITMVVDYQLPTIRSPHQKFVFASIEAANYYPVCSDHFDGFFNWTWTYKLDSEGRWGYIAVKDKNNKIIGPKKEMHWIKLEDMDPVDDNLKKSISSKTKAVAWFLSHCHSKSKREFYAYYLLKELERYNLTIDVYGTCGSLSCSKNKRAECGRLLERYYYFYLSFENAFSEDYVTEKIVFPLQYNTVPIVYGGANYTRFMPDGIYLNAVELEPRDLAKKIVFLMENPEQYYEYFRWKKHYRYYERSESADTDDYCQFCEMLNNKELVEKVSIYKNFGEWWSPQITCSVSYNSL